MANNTENYRPFTTLLVANRGEIAHRILLTAKQQGYRTVAIYSPIDRDSPHVSVADIAIELTSNSIDQSYLDSDQVLAAATITRADAIHPGYGFFSENADFAKRCQQEGIVFIGPTPDTIAIMGSKRQAKIAMQAAGVPCVPGYQGKDQSDEALLAASESIGWPLMIKASAGGGGRGMRLVHQACDFIEQLAMARNEALTAFGSDEVILEKALINARHIEIQVFGDCFGNAVHLGERDCSMQRRHQKVIEEAPSPVVDETLRKLMGDSAIQAAKACDYIGAGTIEFMLDSDNHFYFLEMNTRLQVEHPVTELITGLDLVDWQLHIASGFPLPKKQSDISLNGHAIEVRLYAEDPAEQFLPQTGQIDAWVPAQNTGIRIDAGIVTGQCIGSHYDPMLAKVIAFGENREIARKRLIQALDQTVITGLRCNKAFLSYLLQDKMFFEGKATTDYIDHQLDINELIKDTVYDHLLGEVIGAVFLMQKNTIDAKFKNWTNSLNRSRKLTFSSQDNSTSVITIASLKEGYQCSINDKTVSIGHLAVQPYSTNTYHCIFSKITEDSTVINQSAVIYYQQTGNNLTVWINGIAYEYREDSLAAPDNRKRKSNGNILAPMDGSIFKLCISEGESVKSGQLLATLEAMKMEHPLKADCDGIVKNVSITEGEQVRIRQPLIIIEPELPTSPHTRNV